MLLLLVTTIPILLLFKNNRKKNIEEGHDTRKQLPLGPKKLHVIGNLHHLGSLPHRALERLSHEHVPLMFFRLGCTLIVVVSSADMVREIFINHDLAFSGRPALYARKKLSYGCLDIVLSPYNEYWRQVHKISMLELMSVKRVESFRAIREEEVGFLITSITHSSFSSFSSISLSEKTLTLVNNILCRTVFGKKYEDGGREYGKSRFHEILQETLTLLGGFNLADFFPRMELFNWLVGIQTRLEKNFQELDDIYELVIKDHLDRERLEPEHEDLVDVLLWVRRDFSYGIRLTSNHIKGILVDMFIAGTDTSSSVLVWAITELVRNPMLLLRWKNRNESLKDSLKTR